MYYSDFCPPEVKKDTFRPFLPDSSSVQLFYEKRLSVYLAIWRDK